MKLNYAYSRISSLFSQTAHSDFVITNVSYDTRKINSGESSLFFALNGSFRDGHAFIEDAYSKGVRHFVVSEKGVTDSLEGASEIVVSDTFEALQQLAKFHRSQFEYPVVAITGSYGKTTVKEWLAELLSQELRIVRSPKSYNSRLGVALSLLEMNSMAEVAIIETGISEPGDMSILADMIQPTHGIFTGLGNAHRSNFESKGAHLNEKLILFENTKHFFYPAGILSASNDGSGIDPDIGLLEKELSLFHSSDKIKRLNAALAVSMAKELGVSNQAIQKGLAELTSLSMRLETFDGVRNTSIINDAYNLDQDSLRYALEYQLSNSQGQKRILVVGFGNDQREIPSWVHVIANEFSVDEVILYKANSGIESSLSNASILIKGNRAAELEKLAARLKLHQHQTYLQIDLGAIRKNIAFYKSKLQSSTKLLCMVKASSYGSSALKVGHFLEHLGVNYLGVAYPNEGIELRENGVTLPILVMNCEEESFESCIEHQLEPAIFSLRQLESFIQQLILMGESNYPVHVKLETGMNRLGFGESDLNSLIEKIQSQPEIFVKSVYSHLAEADVKDSDFTQGQIDRFENLSKQLTHELANSPIRHILNSEGISNYTKAQFDMVRLGIGMYGHSSNLETVKQLKPAINWFSSVSQVKQLKAPETVGYGRTFAVEKDMKIAVIPVGYADGFRRNLSQGKGGVYINGTYCPTVGNVCMDMIMVDVSGIDVQEKDEVEIIGEHQTIEELAKKMDTIPYEVMTHFSPRIHRVYLD
ncbi:MAG: alanine racemase [Crocinitomicaceae bacterium]|nr:alanine racemase [Crocinitomicaceae bacterium]